MLDDLLSFGWESAFLEPLSDAVLNTVNTGFDPVDYVWLDTMTGQIYDSLPAWSFSPQDITDVLAGNPSIASYPEAFAPYQWDLGMPGGPEIDFSQGPYAMAPEQFQSYLNSIPASVRSSLSDALREVTRAASMQGRTPAGAPTMGSEQPITFTALDFPPPPSIPGVPALKATEPAPLPLPAVPGIPSFTPMPAQAPATGIGQLLGSQESELEPFADTRQRLLRDLRLRQEGTNALYQ